MLFLNGVKYEPHKKGISPHMLTLLYESKAVKHIEEPLSNTDFFELGKRIKYGKRGCAPLTSAN
jgi:hypothetical protein